jgi:hypothetical protein
MSPPFLAKNAQSAAAIIEVSFSASSTITGAGAASVSPSLRCLAAASCTTLLS